jgi:hypothetical protein
VAPPETVTLGDGTPVALRPLAELSAERHLRRHPEDLERYGDLARDWCIHDTQHLLQWAGLEAAGQLAMATQVEWLAGVLHARGYPLANLASNLETAAEVVDEALGEPGRPVAEALRAAVDAVGPRRS